MPENYFVFDIETAFHGKIDPKTARYLMDKSFSKRTHPVFAKVIAIGYKLPNQETVVLGGEDEKTYLERFWKVVREEIPERYVTFGGYEFDVPFLKVRSRINGISPTENIDLKKWSMWNSNHFDCMWALSHLENFLNVKLEIACLTLGIEADYPTRELPIQDLYEKGKWNKIKKHCRNDVELTEKLYKKIGL